VILISCPENGDVWGWGINGFGQLGGGDTVTHEIPIKLKGVMRCFAFIIFDSSLQLTLLGFPANITQIACGQSHTLLLTEAGEVYSFGRNAYGQLGHGEDEPVRLLSVCLFACLFFVCLFIYLFICCCCCCCCCCLCVCVLFVLLLMASFILIA
jgi:hypothetical protein